MGAYGCLATLWSCRPAGSSAPSCRVRVISHFSYLSACPSPARYALTKVPCFFVRVGSQPRPRPRLITTVSIESGTMESWESYNLTDLPPNKWLELMNLSTADWGMGFFPPNVVAIPTELNDSFAATFPPGYLIIENAGADINTEPVFAATSVPAVVLMIAWFLFSLRDGFKWWRKPAPGSDTRAKPRPPRSPLSGRSSETYTGNGSELGVGIGVGGGGFRAVEFEKKLDRYYPRFASHAEVYERDKRGPLEAEEVTAVSELLVRMFRNDTQLRALQTQEVGREEMDRLRAESDAMLAEVHRRVLAWTTAGLDEEESRVWQEVRAVLARHQAPRYMYREGGGTVFEGV